MDVIQTYLVHASIETTRSTCAPKTPTHVIEDQIVTFGLRMNDLLQRAKSAAQKKEE